MLDVVPTPVPISGTSSRSAFPWWVFLGAVLIPCLYLTTLRTRFDFIDDGNTVYAAPSMPLGQRLHVVWNKIVANYEHLGPFRPVLWVHWEAEADLLGGSAFRWRAARLIWAWFACGALLWLLRELKIRRGAALITTALAMWYPYRSEIWTSLTLSEGVAMPYALLGLVCAIRAARSQRPWPWDIGAALCVLAALGCKNTFAALVPAQLLLRIAPDGRDFREGWKRHGRRACLLALTLLLPVGHYIFFKLNWHGGQYETHGASWMQLERLLRAIRGAIGFDMVGPGLVLAGIALWIQQRTNRTNLARHSRYQSCSLAPVFGGEGWGEGADTRPWHGYSPHPRPLSPEYGGEGRKFARVARILNESSAGTRSWLAAAGTAWRDLYETHRAPCLAGLALLICGIGVYLPLDAVSARYTMPAVWGADLWIAALLSRLAVAAHPSWRRVAYALLACGVVAVTVANVGKQAKFAARAAVLWKALEYVERSAPPGACVGWVSGPDLDPEEGIHFAWHLQARGRSDLRVCLLDAECQPLNRREILPASQAPSFLMTGNGMTPAGMSWPAIHEFSVSYWLRQRRYHCFLHQPVECAIQTTMAAER